MWWAERAGPPLLLVLRADALDAGWAGATDAAQWHHASQPLDGAAGDLQAAVRAAFAALRGTLAAAAPGPRCEMRLLLAGPCVATLGLPWSEALLREEGAQFQARAALRQGGCDPQPVDRVSLDGAPGLGRPRTVFWVPAWLLAEAQALADALGARLASVQPLHSVAAAWMRHQDGGGRPGQASGLLGSGLLQLQHGAGGSAQLADADAALALPERAAALWRRAQVRHPALATADGLRLLALDEAPPTAPGPDAIVWQPWPGDGRSRTALDRALLQHARAQPTLEALPAARRSRPWRVAALLCVGAALWLAVGAWQRQSAADQLAAQAANTAVPRPAPVLSPAELAEVRAVNAAVRQINLPLPALLRALQPPRDIPVRLLALDMGGRAAEGAAGAGGAIKLTAQAPASLDMTRYVGFLGARRGLAGAQLVRHEIDPALPGSPYRFEVELAWQP